MTPSTDRAKGRYFIGFTPKFFATFKIRDRALPNIFSRPGNAGKRELFAEGIAWHNRPMQNLPDGVDSPAQPEFYGSVAAGYHLASYYRALDKELGIPQ
ncbi:hypothetical protein [Nocardia brevicatena]|uniref:hypothetical protein n=1 Tax=Nocardia brevicatena TaxID=37327 RepID=UPI001C3F2F70|nr:hypothetical protein [Nocardia brevicatena]